MYQDKEPMKIYMDVSYDAKQIDSILRHYFIQEKKKTLVHLNYPAIIDDYLLGLTTVESNQLYNRGQVDRRIGCSDIAMEMTLSTLQSKLIHGAPSLNNDIILSVLNIVRDLLYGVGLQISSIFYSGKVNENYRSMFRFKVTQELGEYHYLLEEIPIGSEMMNADTYTVDGGWIYNELKEDNTPNRDFFRSMLHLPERKHYRFKQDKEMIDLGKYSHSPYKW